MVDQPKSSPDKDIPSRQPESKVLGMKFISLSDVPEQITVILHIPSSLAVIDWFLVVIPHKRWNHEVGYDQGYHRREVAEAVPEVSRYEVGYVH